MNEEKTSVCVVMSTFNGEKYVSEQLDSILLQKDVILNIYIRDDGSTDKTKEILKKYANNNDNIFLEEGKNLGLNRSFWKATQNAIVKFDADYYAFADQDDVWEDNKISIGIKKLLNYSDIPSLYYSNLLLCNQQLNSIGYMYDKGIVKSTYKQALAQIFCWGCTCVFNKKAAELYTKKYYDYSHDCWLFFLCMFCGMTVYDDNSFIKYRRHGSNFGNQGKPIYGEGYSKVKIILDKIKSIKKMTPIFSNMSLDILNNYNTVINKDAYEYVYTVANYRKKIKCKMKLLLTKYISTYGTLKNISIKYRILCNKW